PRAFPPNRSSTISSNSIVVVCISSAQHVGPVGEARRVVRADDGVLEQSHALLCAAVGLGADSATDVVDQTERGPRQGFGIRHVVGDAFSERPALPGAMRPGGVPAVSGTK